MLNALTRAEPCSKHWDSVHLIITFRIDRADYPIGHLPCSAHTHTHTQTRIGAHRASARSLHYKFNGNDNRNNKFPMQYKSSEHGIVHAPRAFRDSSDEWLQRSSQNQFSIEWWKKEYGRWKKQTKNGRAKISEAAVFTRAHTHCSAHRFHLCAMRGPKWIKKKWHWMAAAVDSRRQTAAKYVKIIKKKYVAAHSLAAPSEKHKQNTWRNGMKEMKENEIMNSGNTTSQSINYVFHLNEPVFSLCFCIHHFFQRFQCLCGCTAASNIQN